MADARAFRSDDWPSVPLEVWDPTRATLHETMLRIVTNYQLDREFEDLGRDVDHVLAAMSKHFGEVRLRTNFQIQVLSSLFFRNKGCR